MCQRTEGLTYIPTDESANPRAEDTYSNCWGSDMLDTGKLYSEQKLREAKHCSKAQSNGVLFSNFETGDPCRDHTNDSSQNF